MGKEVTVTLVLYVNEEDEDTFSQSVDIAKVGDEVSIIMHKWYKNFPDTFVRMRFSQTDACTIINGILEAIKDKPKDFLKEEE
jgi:hypothetical protein